MSLSRDEARQLRGIAELLRGHPSPTVLEQLAAVIHTLTEEGVRRATVDDRQGTLFAAPTPHFVPPTPHFAPPTPQEQHDDDSSTTYACSPSSPFPPSSSSDLKDLKEKKKKVQRWRPFTDDPLPEDFLVAYKKVVAERGVNLPSATFMWEKFVETLWEKNRDYATRYGLKRRWRDWVWYEKPLNVPSPALGQAEEASPPKSGARVASDASQANLEQQERERTPTKLAVAEIAKLTSVVFARPPPTPRSMSA